MIERGRLELIRGAGGASKAYWRIEAAPHIMVRLKRTIERISKFEHGTVHLSLSDENCRELAWFLDRFPMDISRRDRRALVSGAREYDRRLSMVRGLVNGTHQDRPTVELALPLRPYQWLPVNIARAKGGTICADELGVGKTVEGLGVIATEGALPALIVVPSQVRRQWMRELQRFTPALRVVVPRQRPTSLTKTPSGERTLDTLKTGAFDVVLLTWSLLSDWADFFGDAVFRSFIADEAQELRIPTSKRYEAAKFLALGARHRLGLTGTPVYNYGGEFFWISNVFSPGELGDVDEFTREWCGQGRLETEGANKGKLKVDDPIAFGKYAREAGLLVRRTGKELGLDLPEALPIPYLIEADVNVLRGIAAEAVTLARMITSRVGGREQTFQARSQLDYLLRHKTGVAKAPFVAAFVEMLLEAERPVLLYGWHKDVYAIWKELLSKWNPVFHTGQQSEAGKDRAKQAFMDGESDLFICSLRSGIGIDGLQKRSSTVVFGELDWSPGVHEQCIGRVKRPGQIVTDMCQAYYLYTDEGSDPVLMDTLGFKEEQLIGIRDPDAPLVTALREGSDHVLHLAQEVLRRYGSSIPASRFDAQPMLFSNGAA